MEDDELRLLRVYKDRLKDRRQLRFRRKFRDDIPEHLSRIIKQFFRQTPESAQQMSHSQILIAWPRIVGEAIARHSSARRIQGERLFVHVLDPLWRQELAFQKSTLLKRLRDEFPQVRIRDIFFTA